MLLVKTKLNTSNIHGVGLFADEDIKKGTYIWEWHDGLDMKLSVESYNNLPENLKSFFSMYAWKEDNSYFLSIDNERFINHAENANCTCFGSQTIIAEVDIQKGEELTINYKEFDDDFGNPEHGYDWM
jgi:SET domain-containing protein